MHLIMNLKHNFSHYSNEILDAMYTTDIKKVKKKPKNPDVHAQTNRFPFPNVVNT